MTSSRKVVMHLEQQLAFHFQLKTGQALPSSEGQAICATQFRIRRACRQVEGQRLVLVCNGVEIIAVAARGLRSPREAMIV